MTEPTKRDRAIEAAAMAICRVYWGDTIEPCGDLCHGQCRSDEWTAEACAAVDAFERVMSEDATASPLTDSFAGDFGGKAGRGDTEWEP